MSDNHDQVTTFRANKRLISDCKAIAKANGSNLSKVIREALEAYREGNRKTLIKTKSK